MTRKEAIRNAQNETCKRTFFFLPTLDFYVLRAFLVPFSILIFAFCFLFLVGDIFNYLGDFLDGKVPPQITFLFFLLKMPGNVRFVLPISVLLACMYTLANFGRNKEISAMRSSGLSLIRCGFAMYVMGAFVTCVNYYFNEKLIPETERKAMILLEKAKDPKYKDNMYTMLQYRSADKLRDWLFQNFSKSGEQKDVILKKYIYGPDKSKLLVWDLRSPRVRYDKKNRSWHFYDAVRTPYHHTLKLPGLPVRYKELVITSEEIPEFPEDILNAVKPPEELSSAVIIQMLKENTSMVPALRGMYETVLYYRLAFPMVCFLCVFLGLPLAAKNERGGIFLSILTAVGLIVVYQLLTEIFLVLGKQGIVPPVVGGLLPTVVFILYGWFFIVRKSG